MPRSPSPTRDSRKRDRSHSRERDRDKRRREDVQHRRSDGRHDRYEESRHDRRDVRDDRRELRDERGGGAASRHDWWDRGRDGRDGRDERAAGDREYERERAGRAGDRHGTRDERRDGRDEGRRDRRPGGGAERGPPPPAAVAEEEGEQLAGSNGAAAASGAAGTKGKAEPLSLEELLRKKKQEQEDAAKPRFLTKAERAALALQRRQEEVGVQRQSLEADRRQRERDAAAEVARREAVRRSAEDRDRDPKESGERERQRELEMIKQQYLGGEKLKKRSMKPSERMRFHFDWDAGEDTSKDLNPLYNNLHEATLLFGRGMRAGIDRREQKKAGATVEAEALRKLRAAAGIEESGESRRQAREREEAADKYDGFDMRVEKHWTDKPLEAMTERDWRIFREDFNIAYRGNMAGALPIRNWDEAQLPRPLRKAVDYVGYTKPSPIQMAAIPLGLKQLDVIGIAETGSGKTAAFVLPMLCYIMKQPPMTEATSADGPYAVVLAPTRELAQQIEEETLKIAHYTDYRVTAVVGGQSIEEQGSKLRRGCEIVIATPGRLLDCLERHYCVLNQCNYVVLDEADRMIDLGFEPQVQAVLDAMPSSTLKPEDEAATLDSSRLYRTTYMFSATMPTAVERLARKYLRRPVVINIGSAGRATDNITQRVVMVKDNEKPARLAAELDLVGEKKIIVFVNTKRQCDNVYGQLEEMGYRCTVLHGGRTQDQREASIKGFRDDTFNVLIATDVAGRGIDVPDVALVVNYDMPNNIEAYTHRIGRTGRAGKKGTAITFLTGGDTEVYFDLKRVLEESKAPVPPELARHEAAKQKPGSVSQKRDTVMFAKGTK